MNNKRKDKKNPPKTNGERSTELGRKLRAISEEYVANGGKLLSREEILREVAEEPRRRIVAGDARPNVPR